MYTEGTTRQVVYRSSEPAVEPFHSLGKLKVDLSPSKCGFVATPRGIALTVCSGWQEKSFGVSSTRHTRDLGVDVSFGSSSVPIARKRAKREGAFGALPRNMLVPVASCSKDHPSADHVWSPDLVHSTHIHETSACCGSVDLGRTSCQNVYHHFACHHKNRAGISFARGSHHPVSCVFARQPFANQET